MFQEWPFLDRFAAAADAGSTAVACRFPYAWPADAVAARLAGDGISLVLFNVSPGNFAAGERRLAALPEQFGALQASVHATLAYAQATATSKLHLLARIADRADPHAIATFRRALVWAGNAAARDAVTLLIEPINRHDMPGYFLCDFAFAKDIVAGLGSPNLHQQFDTYHRQILHGDVMVAPSRCGRSSAMFRLQAFLTATSPKPAS